MQYLLTAFYVPNNGSETLLTLRHLSKYPCRSARKNGNIRNSKKNKIKKMFLDVHGLCLSSPTKPVSYLIMRASPLPAFQGDPDDLYFFLPSGKGREKQVK